jgi:hypothetical protein
VSAHDHQGMRSAGRVHDRACCLPLHDVYARTDVIVQRVAHEAVEFDLDVFERAERQGRQDAGRTQKWLWKRSDVQNVERRTVMLRPRRGMPRSACAECDDRSTAHVTCSIAIMTTSALMTVGIATATGVPCADSRF